MPAGKKKKGASNPARGFATTSIVSKAKAKAKANENENENENLSAKAEKIKDATEASLHGARISDNVQSLNPEQKGKDFNISNLTPEEYADHLEDAQLQQLLEQHVERSTRDVKRASGRLKTDQRLLKTSAEHLDLAAWLPQELLLVINNHLKPATSSEFTHTSRSSSEVYSEDDILIRVWTLYHILVEIGISLEHTRAALRYALQVLPPVSPARFESSVSESLWGLNESFEWLARNSSPYDLTHNDDTGRAGKCRGNHQAKNLPSRNHLGSSLQSTYPEAWTHGPEKSTDSSRGPADLIKAETSTSSSSAVSPRDSPRLASQAAPFDSESESDDDPEALARRYLGLMLRLDELDASLTKFKHRNLIQKSSKSIQNRQETSPQVSHILKKMATIEADVLFDRYEAAEKWDELRNSQAKEVADRKKFCLATDKVTRPIEPDSSVAKDSPMTTVEDSGQQVDVLDTLGDFLSQLPDDNDKIIGQTQDVDRGVSDVSVRNFGNLSGVRPRRVLEETCKARSVDEDWFLNDSYILLHPIAQ